MYIFFFLLSHLFFDQFDDYFSQIARNCQINCQESAKGPKVKSSNCLFRPTNSPKPRDSSFIVINDKEKQQIITFKMCDQQMFGIIT